MRTKSRYTTIQTEFIRHVAALLILWSRNCRNKLDFQNWIVVFLVFPQKVSTLCSGNLFWRNRHPSPTWLILDVDRDPKTWRPIKLRWPKTNSCQCWKPPWNQRVQTRPSQMAGSPTPGLNLFWSDSTAGRSLTSLLSLLSQLWSPSSSLKSDLISRSSGNSVGHWQSSGERGQGTAWKSLHSTSDRSPPPPTSRSNHDQTDLPDIVLTHHHHHHHHKYHHLDRHTDLPNIVPHAVAQHHLLSGKSARVEVSNTIFGHDQRMITFIEICLSLLWVPPQSAKYQFLQLF